MLRFESVTAVPLWSRMGRSASVSRGAYFGPKFALMGPANLLAIQPQFQFHPLQNVTGEFCWIWYWRESTKDAVYSFENVQLRPANPNDVRYVGSQPNLEIRWAISEHFLAALNLAGFVTGTFLHQSPPSKEIVFVNVGLTYRFWIISEEFDAGGYGIGVAMKARGKTGEW